MASKRDLILQAAVGMIAQSGVRGLRVEEIAAKAGASTGLIYYHFKDRAGLLRATLDYISDRADRYTAQAIAMAKDAGDSDARSELEQTLLLELQDTDEIRENSTAWGELRASAIFDTDLRERLEGATAAWVAEMAERVALAQEAGQAREGVEPEDVAERLTALVEGLSERWLSGTLGLERARDLLRGAIVAELGPGR
ncbi:TetR family transcriptional regulator [Catenulispora sp. NF23]|uniref:TetR family transcriptional regulator n=1 Tax=Catenulispora pinistramenti TaxID=2705254 RepID=A0ABS5L6H6_9ACTN|nr:TetR/AcrR family transcriptional regulator [Catenulispora pinistramenti]MBS2538261.1 TetR family transcriptional regulator [Catenulispora pinistramenti]MBS2553739.1 TetR family transcriptional regulator [Catenulispora pinistramenti]